MSVNRGKQFESVVKDAFECVQGVSVDRLYDNQSGYTGIATIADFVVYKEPYEYYIECKSVHGNRLSINSNDPKKKYGNISNKQWEGMLEKSKIQGVFAGVLCWFIDHDVTVFLPIQTLNIWKTQTFVKSVPYNIAEYDFDAITIQGVKKRVFFDYDFKSFFEHFEKCGG